MRSHTTPSFAVPAPRGPEDAIASPIEPLERLRRRVALTLARSYIYPPGQRPMSERTGALLDGAAR